MNSLPLFHLAIPVGDIPQAKAFYCERLGCRSGRETPQALILDFYGHQLVAHATLEAIPVQKGVYPRHFGVIFAELKDWQDLAEKLQRRGTEFVVEPKQRFSGQPAEHHTFFISDPFGNLLEFKAYRYPEAIFGAQDFTAIGDR